MYLVLQKDPKVQCLPNSEDHYQDSIKCSQTRDSYHKPVGISGSLLLDQPLLQIKIVEMHLDSVFKDKSNKLSVEVSIDFMVCDSLGTVTSCTTILSIQGKIYTGCFKSHGREQHL